MKASVQGTDLRIREETRRLLRRMVSPLCGLDQRISFMTRGELDPRLMTAGAELTGVHVLQRRPQPRFPAYHIGGGGIFIDEPLIRTLGETIERYSQLLSEVSRGNEFVVASYNAMVSRGEPIIASGKLEFFVDSQFAVTRMPFQRFDPTRPITWTRVQEVSGGTTMWVPAQLVLVGYAPKSDDGEPWLNSALTTGTASHTDPQRALRNALLELIQIDAAMGHWYTDANASEIVLDGRTSALKRLIDKHFPRPKVAPKFYWLPNVDLPGLPIACVIRSGDTLPSIGVGLGCDLGLVQAMYKALLEAVSVRQLAKINLLYQTNPNDQEASNAQAQPMVDFDSNVAFYAWRGNQEFIDIKYTARSAVHASDLPSDYVRSVGEGNAMLVDAFRVTKKQLMFMDLTTEDVRALGFRTLRVWSPDTLSLSVPSFPTKAHSRYASYGGVRHERPHPYA